MTVAPWSSVDNSTCDHCGAHVTDRFRRVFGDDDRAIDILDYLQRYEYASQKHVTLLVALVRRRTWVVYRRSLQLQDRGRVARLRFVSYPETDTRLGGVRKASGRTLAAVTSAAFSWTSATTRKTRLMISADAFGNDKEWVPDRLDANEAILDRDDTRRNSHEKAEQRHNYPPDRYCLPDVQPKQSS